MEFETGYGLEADLPNIICYRIQQRYMVDPTRAGDYDRAVQQGVAAIIRHLRPPAALPKPVLRTAADSTKFYVDSLQRAIMAQSRMLDDEDPLNTALPGEALTPAYYTPPEPGPEPAAAWLLAALALILYLALWHHTTRGWPRRDRLLLVPFGVVVLLLLLALGLDWPATAGDLAALCYGLPLLYLTGYFGWRAGQRRAGGAPQARADEYNRLRHVHHDLGYTAWLFPLPLAGYWWWHWRWLHRLRHVGLACPTCGQPLRQVVGEAAAAHLTPGQQAEEKIESVAYDAWECPAGHGLTLAYPNPSSTAQPCPACHFRTFTERRQQPVQAATARAAGWGWDVTQCHFCQHERKRKYAIARLATPAAGSSGSGSGSSWSGSSGSSSGSSSSTSGGGSSGGGGAAGRAAAGRGWAKASGPRATCSLQHTFSCPSWPLISKT